MNTDIKLVGGQQCASRPESMLTLLFRRLRGTFNSDLSRRLIESGASDGLLDPDLEAEAGVENPDLSGAGKL